ncbi:hypothetical protein [Halomarina pelagica]|uniref:hypothetical protein n=1 Tax=Halomarina pelagica TaxID=2961599 RepID=UPI0020C46439|nr:hypothetical protein [Halomarina sp. BND7]
MAEIQTSARSDQRIRRRTVLRALGGIGASAFAVSGRGAAQASAIPTNPTYYQVIVEGATTHQPFRREVLLLVAPPLDRTTVNFDNGQNARDIALRSGNPAGLPEAGSIWFATNTSLYDAVGIPSNTDASNIDVAIVAADAAKNLLQITVDGRVWGLPSARSAVLNNFNSRSGLTAGVYQIIQGEILLQFMNGGQTVEGELNLVGNGYIEPGTFRYVATIAGQVTQPPQG